MKMMKAYPIEIVLSLTTGFLLKEGGFGDMHELVEWVLGHPVWTHELADKGFFARLQEAVFAQHPDLRTAEIVDVDKMKPDIKTYLEDYTARAIEKYGRLIEVQNG